MHEPCEVDVPYNMTMYKVTGCKCGWKPEIVDLVQQGWREDHLKGKQVPVMAPKTGYVDILAHFELIKINSMEAIALALTNITIYVGDLRNNG